MHNYSHIPIRNKLKISWRTLLSPPGPRFGSLFITRKCNLECPYCKVTSFQFKDLNTDQWQQVIDKLYRWGVRIFSITGGEPLLRKDIHEIIRHISKIRKAIPWLISNFKIMTRNTIDQLADDGLLFLTASLDSLTQTGVKSDSSILDLLSYAKSRGIICSTITVLHQGNYQEIPEIMRKVTERGIIFDLGFFQHIGGMFSPADSSQKVNDLEALETLREKIRSHKLQTGLVAPSWGFLKTNLQMYREMSWKCPAERDTYLVVNNDGRLMTCQEFLADISVLTIDELDDPRWRTVKKETVQQCRGCFYGCYYQKVNISLIDLILDSYSMLKV
jgi:MoaA/NifB/PqqE/SkfB family radical SAM enzyme